MFHYIPVWNASRSMFPQSPGVSRILLVKADEFRNIEWQKLVADLLNLLYLNLLD